MLYLAKCLSLNKRMCDIVVGEMVMLRTIVLHFIIFSVQQKCTFLIQILEWEHNKQTICMHGLMFTVLHSIMVH